MITWVQTAVRWWISLFKPPVKVEQQPTATVAVEPPPKAKPARKKSTTKRKATK